LTLLLTAVAFVLATSLPNTAPASAMPTGKPCSGCADKAPAGNDLGKMMCGALACAGVAIGLPARPMPYQPAFAKLTYMSAPARETIGAVPAPDPFPPRPIVLD
jgi:hypothetical protein